jgi:hypothetical protein
MATVFELALDRRSFPLPFIELSEAADSYKFLLNSTTVSSLTLPGGDLHWAVAKATDYCWVAADADPLPPSSGTPAASASNLLAPGESYFIEVGSYTTLRFVSHSGDPVGVNVQFFTN